MSKRLKTHSCPVCHKHYACRENLLRHLHRSHMKFKDTTNIKRCPCGRPCFSLDDFMRHFRRVHGGLDNWTQYYHIDLLGVKP